MVLPTWQNMDCVQRDCGVMVHPNRRHVDYEHRYCGVMLCPSWLHVECQTRYCCVIHPTRRHGDCEQSYCCVMLHFNVQHIQDCMQIYSDIYKTFALCPTTIQHVYLRDCEERFCHLISRLQHNCQQYYECMLLCPTWQHIVYVCKNRYCFVILCPIRQHVDCTKRYCVILCPTVQHSIRDCKGRCGAIYDASFYCCQCLQHAPHCRQRYCHAIMYSTAQHLCNLRDCVQSYCAKVYGRLL